MTRVIFVLSLLVTAVLAVTAVRAQFPSYSAVLMAGSSARPTDTLTANPTNITSGSSSTLSWSSTNAQSCVGTNFSTGGAISGSVSVSPAVTTLYSVNCAGVTASATVTVTGGGGTPAPAVAAGFTTLALNADFSQPSYFNIANWVDGCGGSTTAPRWWYGWFGTTGSSGPHQGAPCAALIMENDPQAGTQVLHLQYLPAYNAIGTNTGSQILELNYPAPAFTSQDASNYFPSTYYVEIVSRQGSASSLTQAHALNNNSFWLVLDDATSPLEEDFYEVQTNGGPPNWNYQVNFEIGSAADFTVYHTFGALYTGDGTSIYPYLCAFRDGVVLPDQHGNSCTNLNRTGNMSLHDGIILLGFGTDSNDLATGAIINNIDVYIQSIKVWTCANAFMTSTNCFGTIVNHWPFP